MQKPHNSLRSNTYREHETHTTKNKFSKARSLVNISLSLSAADQQIQFVLVLKQKALNSITNRLVDLAAFNS